MQCYYCEREFDESVENYTIDRKGNYWCEDCADMHLSYCEHCDNYVEDENITRVEGNGGEEYWCTDCAENDALLCAQCGCYTVPNYGNDDNPLCEECSERWIVCEDCGELVDRDCCYSDDYGYYCEECWSENHCGDVHDYGYSPDLKFHDTEDDFPAVNLPYLGFELEIGGVSNSDKIEASRRFSDPCEDEYVFKEDGSIPEYGFEVVSQPMTLLYHKQEANWKKLLSDFSNFGFRSHDLGPDGCGLHVHVSRNFMNSWRWILVDWFINKYQAQWEILARREECHWARFKHADGTEKPLKEVYGKSDSRYQAVNFCNYNTVEFRLFRGTLKYSTFIATLELVDGVVHWAKQVKVHDLLVGDVFQQFIHFLRTDSRYEEAVTYIKEKGLSD